jgi:hypothetical protein
VLTNLIIGRGADPGHLELTQFLQYGALFSLWLTILVRTRPDLTTPPIGSGQGNAKLIQWCKTLTENVHAPPTAYDCILHPGNTNAWAKAVGLLCEDNDFVIVEEYTYPSAQAHTIPLGIKAVPIPADAEGIEARSLEDMLASWDEEERGGRRPRLSVTDSHHPSLEIFVGLSKKQALPRIRRLKPNRNHHLHRSKKRDLRSLQEIRCVQSRPKCTILPGNRFNIPQTSSSWRTTPTTSSSTLSTSLRRPSQPR